jgi:hypothetical protein
MKKSKRLHRRWARNASLGLISFLSLAGCTRTLPPEVITKMQVESVTVPAALLTVPDEPVVPTSRMQSAAADYIVHLKINDDECHLDVGAIAASQK